MRIVKIFGSFSFLHFTVFYISTIFLPCVFLDPLSLNEPNLDIQYTSASSENSTYTSIIDQSEIKNNLTAETSQTERILETKVPKEQELKLQYSEVISQSSAIEKEIINNDTPIAVSQVDSATKEFQENVPPLSSEGASQDEATKHTNVSHNLPGVTEEETNVNITISVSDSEKPTNNLTDKVAEDIPSFSEWAQKQLEEVERKEQTNYSTPTQHLANTTKPGSAAKLRWKNYASVDCGAKVILANSEGKNSWAILSPSRDEYKLDPCNSRIWFIVELCEAIQLKKIDIANYELFSSSPKKFTVSVSDRFPTRDWSVIGNFEAKDDRDVQSFDITTDTFGKYVKVEIKSHYGSEHYCPLSLFRAYGTNVFEVLQKDDPAHEQPIEDDDDDDDDDDEALDNAIKSDGHSGNILSSATDAVLSMVKKAAQVLGNKVTNDSSQLSNGTSSEISIMKSCTSPSHYVVCNNCSDLLFGKIFELLSCKQEEIKNLVRIPFVKQSLISSDVCKGYGFHLGDKSSKNSLKACPECVVSFFPTHYIGAMCNVLATIQNKVLYNTSYQYGNITEPTQVLSDMEEESKINLTEIDFKKDSVEDTSPHRPTEPLNVDQLNINSKASCSTDATYTSKIKPSKSLLTELPEHSELNTVSANAEEAAEQVGNVEQQEDPDISNVEPTTLAESTTEVLLEVETTESSGEDNMDKMMTDLSSEPSPIVNTANAATLQGQKESVFLRLSNRIKALERNMSLSGQYLEELSKRYKKQVEEMQRVLEKTENTLKKVSEKDEERLQQLEDKIDSLTVAVETLLSERDSWKVTSYWLFFAGGVLCLIYCYKRCSTPECTASPVGAKHTQIQRRNSTDSVISQSPKKKKRRPSDQALKIVRTAAAGDQERSKKRRKKTSIQTDSLDGSDKFLPRCTSSKIWLPKSQSADWVESRRVIEDIPFVLDECDNSTLEPLPFADEVEVIKIPPFVTTATNARLNRSFKSKKSQSVEETRSRQPSPVSSITGSVSSSADRTPKKEKKGFKRLFKRVF